MRRPSLVLAGLCALGVLPGSARGFSPETPAAVRRQDGPIRLNFADTDVSEVLRAISLKTRVNIVFPAQLKKPISIKAAAGTVDEALRLVTAAAGLAYRQVGVTYVVAAPADLRQALEPLGERARLAVGPLTPAEAVTLLEGALPFLTARPAGAQVLVVGAPEDIAQARALLAEQEKMRPDAGPPAAEVVTLRYASASQVAAMLKNMFPGLKADAVGAADKMGGIIGLAGSRTQVEGARETIRTVDVPAAPTEPDRQYRVYFIKYSSAPELKDFMDKAAPGVSTLIGPESYSPPMPGFRPLTSVNLGASTTGGSGLGGGLGGANSGFGSGLGGQSGLGGGMGGSFGQTEQRRQREGDRAKALVLSGTAVELDAAFKLLEQIDVPPKQVLVEVKVVDTSPERVEELGLTWNWTSFGFNELPPGSNTQASGTTAQTTRRLGFGQFSRLPWSFNAILSAMVTRREAKLLASPRMQVTDNDEANIFIGDTIRAQISQSSISGTTIQIVEFPVGIILLVRPRINAEGNITMRIHPVVSTITDLSSANIPQTSTREAETTVMVQDGETVVIGGLIRDEMTKTVREVPLLSKLPLVGELFRNRSTNQRHSEILVFITPHIVK